MKKVAILIDGGFFLKRINSIPISIINKELNLNIEKITPEIAVSLVDLTVQFHVENRQPANELYRIFYYDSYPYEIREHLPISGRTVDFKKSDQAKFRQEFFELLQIYDSTALRLGTVKKQSTWHLKPYKNEEFLKFLKNDKPINKSDFKDDDFQLNLKQAGVDIRIGVDIATLALKKLVDIIVLISGDGDFAPAAKLARTEGVKFILDVMGANVSKEMIEHSDGFRSTFFSFENSHKLSKIPSFTKTLNT